MLVFDVETDGLLDKLSHIKCLNMLDTETGAEYRYTDAEFYEEPVTTKDADGKVSLRSVRQGAPTKRTGTMAAGLKRLANASEIGGHFVIGFDLPAIRKVYPTWAPKGRVFDSTVMTRVIYTNLYDLDIAAIRKGKLPREFETKRLVGSHKLVAWGLRLGGPLKRDWTPMQVGQTWENYSFSEDCDDYCMDDVRTNAHLFAKLAAKGYDDRCFQIEHRVQVIINRQEAHGWLFDVPAAEKLTATLQKRKVELEAECATVFKPWYIRLSSMTGRNHTLNGTTKGADWTKIRWVTFNPASRDHIADRLTAIYGWKPTETTDGGKPKVDETILESLPYPEAAKLAEFFTVNKRLGQVAEGKQAWLKAVKADGRIHGRVNTNGAVTGRMTHNSPNVAQCPANHSPYGEECRSLWIVPPGKKLVGVDADGLELRMLAHYMAKHDGGAYVQIVVSGVKEDGTDVHTMNRKALGLNSRDNAKTWIYAFLYGAGNMKLGTIVYEDFPAAKQAKFNEKFPAGRHRETALVALGKRSRDQMAAGFPALAKLVNGVKAAAKARGYLVGLDGRHIHVRSQHAALNSLLQSAGAVVLKQALCLMFDAYDDKWPNGEVEPVGNIHDEVQIECLEGIANEVAEIASNAIVRAGEILGLRCPLAAGSDIGDDWSSTH